MSMISNNREMTEKLGRALAKQLQPGDTVLLDGPMGAGKSELARGIARGLGVQGPVPSPSFTILNCYNEGTIPLFHFDWWRIGDESELYDIGAEEYVSGSGVCLIEWYQNGPSLVPEDVLRVRIVPLDDERREITLIPEGHFREITLKEDDIQ